MRQKITLILCLTMTMSYSQITSTIFNEVSNSSGLAIDGDNLYIGAILENSIYKLDWTETYPTGAFQIDAKQRF